MTVFPQGIIGDPGLPGRDGDPGIEVLHSADSDILMMDFGCSLLVHNHVSFLPHRLIKDRKVSVENLDKLE